MGGLKFRSYCDPPECRGRSKERPQREFGKHAEALLRWSGYPAGHA